MRHRTAPDPPPTPGPGIFSDPDFRVPDEGADAPADRGHPCDGDLNQMSDDGCPHSPDPLRWADLPWRDQIGE